MSSVFKALQELKLNKDWVLKEEPTNKAEFENQFLVVVGVDGTNTAINSSDPNDFGVTWEQVVAKQTELQNAEPMRLLREERNKRLQETDWRFRSDLTPSQEWIDYCQALRDLPSTASPELDENGQLINVTWPTKPE